MQYLQTMGYCHHTKHWYAKRFDTPLKYYRVSCGDYNCNLRCDKKEGKVIESHSNSTTVGFLDFNPLPPFKFYKAFIRANRKPSVIEEKPITEACICYGLADENNICTECKLEQLD